MPINNSYDEAAIVEAIATALDNFYTNLIKKVDSLNVKTVMKRKNPYLFRAKAMNGAKRVFQNRLLAVMKKTTIRKSIMATLSCWQIFMAKYFIILLI